MALLLSAHRRAALRIRVALVVLASACILSLAASTARAAEQWNDGVPATSTQVKCVINLQETGAIAKAGYLADPAKPPTAGQVFYGHADFGATTDTACSSGDQVAELDVVLPPGVSLAIDAAHPITCLYTDNDGPQTNYPTCPTQRDRRRLWAGDPVRRCGARLDDAGRARVRHPLSAEVRPPAHRPGGWPLSSVGGRDPGVPAA